MRLCPLCQSVYPDNAYYCSVHGVRLADVRPHIHQEAAKTPEPAVEERVASCSEVVEEPPEPIEETRIEALASAPAVIIPDPPSYPEEPEQAEEAPAEAEIVEQEEEPVEAEMAELEEEPAEVEMAEQEEPVEADIAEQEEPVEAEMAELQEEPVEAAMAELQEEPVEAAMAEQEEAPVEAEMAEQEKPVQAEMAEQEEEPVEAEMAEQEEPAEVQLAEQEEEPAEVELAQQEEPAEVQLAEQEEEPAEVQLAQQEEEPAEVQLAEQEEEPAEAELADQEEVPVAAKATTQQDEEDLTGTNLRSYKLIKHLGTGATGPVYLAKHIHEHNRVAIKILHSKLTDDPKAVAKAYSTLEHLEDLGHRNLVETTERVHELDSPSFYVMEALAGANLFTTLASSTKLTGELILEIALQMARTLAATHQVKVYHGHLTPRNVFLLNRGTAESMLKVLDFDAAPLLEPRPVDEATAFSKQYRAPELAELATPTAMGDIYGLGAIINEMLESLGENKSDEAPVGLMEFVEACMDSELDERPDSMKKVVETLEEISRNERARPKANRATRESGIVWAPEALIDPDVEEAQEEIDLYEWKMRTRSARKRRLGFFAALCAIIALGYQGRDMIPDALDMLEPPALALVAPSSTLVAAAIQEEAAPTVAKTEKPQLAKAAPAKVTKPAPKPVAKPAPKAVAAPAPKPAPKSAPKPAAKPVAPKPKALPAPVPKPAPAPVKRRRPVVETKVPKSRMVRVEFTSSPLGAKVMRSSDDAVIGTTPVVLELPQGPKADVYRFTLKGYETTTQKVTPTASMRVIATMDLVEKPKPKPARAEKTEDSADKEPSSPADDRHALIDPFADEQG